MKKILSGVSKSLYKTTKIALLCGVSLTCASAATKTTLVDPSSVTDIAVFLNPNVPLNKAEILKHKDQIKKMIMLNKEQVEEILDRSYRLRRLYNEAFREEHEKIKAELAKAKSALADKEEALLDKEKALDKNKAKLQMATKSRMANMLMSSARKTKISSLTEQLEKANIAVAGLTQEKAQLTSKIAGLEESLAKSNQALAAANEELQKKEAKIAKLKIVADGLVLRIKELQKGSEDDKAANAAEMRTLNEQLVLQRQKLETQKSALSAATAKTAQLQEQIAAKDKIIQDLEKIKAENATLKTQLDEATKSAQRLQGQKKALEDRLLENTELATAEQEKLKRQIEEKGSELAAVNETLAGAVRASEELTQKLNDANLKLDVTIKLSEHLENELLDTKDALQDTKEDLEAEKRKVKKIKEADAARLAAEERRRAEEAAAEEEAEKQRLAARESRSVRGDRR